MGNPSGLDFMIALSNQLSIMTEY